MVKFFRDIIFKSITIYFYHGSNNEIIGKGISYVNTVNSKIRQVTVSFCWKQRNGRVIGEDTNLNGQEDTGEGDGDGLIESPVQIVTNIYDI